MTIKELKEYIQSRGVTVSGYNKQSLITLAKAVHSMNLSQDPNFENDSLSQCLNNRLTLPAGKVVPDPFAMKNLSNDLSNLPPFGLMDIFNHLILSNAEYDKEKLASFRSFEDYTLFQDGYVRSMRSRAIKDDDDKIYFIIVGEVMPTQKDKTQEGTKHYKLWFILKPNGSVYSAFCRCKGGADQGCKHLSACLYELDDFLSNNRVSCTSLPAYWEPKPTPKHQAIPFKEIKISHSKYQNGKRKITPYDETWVDSFDPRPKKMRYCAPLHAQERFSEGLLKIDPDGPLLKYLPMHMSDVHSTNDNCRLKCPKSIFEMAESFVEHKNINDLQKAKEEAAVFCQQLSLSDDERHAINQCTIGQRDNVIWTKMRHLMVTSTSIKHIYTRQKTIEKKPKTDVSITVQNFLLKQQTKYAKNPAPLQYGIDNENIAKTSYEKLLKKSHHCLELEETGLIVSQHQRWLGSSPDCIRKCSCCKSVVVEIKCPFTGADLDPKEAFLLDSVGGTHTAEGKPELKKVHPYYFQVQTHMAVTNKSTCDFVIYTKKGIFIVPINFNKEFWYEVISKVSSFYTEQIIPNVLFQLWGKSKLGNKSISEGKKSTEFNSRILQDDNDDLNEYTEDGNETQFECKESIGSCNKTLEDNYELIDCSKQDVCRISDEQESNEDSKTFEDELSFEQYEEPINIANNNEHVSSKLELTDLITFLKRDDTREILNNFISKGCGDISSVSARCVTNDVIKIMKKTIGDDNCESDILDDLLVELFDIFPSLNKGLNPLDISQALLTTHELVKMYINQL